MKTITIQVDSEVAKAYEEAPSQQQENASLILNLVMKELLKSTQFNELVRQIREETTAKGLTPEILAELLEDD